MFRALGPDGYPARLLEPYCPSELTRRGNDIVAAEITQIFREGTDVSVHGIVESFRRVQCPKNDPLQ
jgi:hypothetical protein